MGCRVVSNLSTDLDIVELEQVTDERKEISYIQQTAVSEPQLQSRNQGNIVELEYLAEQRDKQDVYPQIYSEPVSLQTIKIKSILRNSENFSSSREKKQNHSKNVQFSKKKRVKRIKRSIDESKIFSSKLDLQLQPYSLNRRSRS